MGESAPRANRSLTGFLTHASSETIEIGQCFATRSRRKLSCADSEGDTGLTTVVHPSGKPADKSRTMAMRPWRRIGPSWRYSLGVYGNGGWVYGIHPPGTYRCPLYFEDCSVNIIMIFPFPRFILKGQLASHRRVKRRCGQPRALLGSQNLLKFTRCGLKIFKDVPGDPP